MPISKTSPLSNINFTGFWLPKCIITLGELSLEEKILLAYLVAFFLNGKKFFASNAHIALIINTRLGTASKTLNSLCFKQYIKVESFDGRQRIIVSELKTKHIMSKIKEDAFHADQGRRSNNDKLPNNKEGTDLQKVHGRKTPFKKPPIRKD